MAGKVKPTDSTIPTKAQLKFLRAHVTRGGVRSGDGKKPYTFVSRILGAGWITVEPIDGLPWQYGWKSTTITPAGRALLASSGKTGE